MGALHFHIGERVNISPNSRTSLRFATTQEELILAVLLLAYPASVSRLQLAKAIWPDSDDRLALQSLRQRVHLLKLQFPELLRAEKESLSINLGSTLSVSTDSLRPDNGILDQASRLAKTCAIQKAATVSHRTIENQVELLVDETRHGKLFTESLNHNLIEKALDRSGNIEDAVYPAVLVLASRNPIISYDAALALASHISNATLKDKRLVNCQWICCQLGASLSHQYGNWARALMFQKRAIELSQDRDQLSWATFRHLRTKLDTASTKTNALALNMFVQDKTISVHLNAMAELSCIFTSSFLRSHEEASKSISLCTSYADRYADFGFRGWLYLNQATSKVLLKKPKEAIPFLLEAANITRNRIGNRDAAWQWMVAAQVFSALGETRLAAEFDALSDLATATYDIHLSPTNRRIYNHILSATTSTSSPSEWLRNSEVITRLKVSELQDFYIERVSIAANNLR